MAYRIEYSEGILQKSDVMQRKSGRSMTSVIAIVVAIVGVVAIYCIGRNRLYDVLIPGDPAVTEAAAIKFVEEIQQGTTIIDAFGVFCREVINGAKISGVY